jgi:hypothetical protein
VRWDFGYCGHYWPIVPAPDERWWLWRNWWNEDWQGKPKFSEKTCPSVTFVHHKIPHDQTRVWTRVAAVGSQRLTAWAMARPWVNIYFLVILWMLVNSYLDIFMIWDHALKIYIRRDEIQPQQSCWNSSYSVLLVFKTKETEQTFVVSWRHNNLWYCNILWLRLNCFSLHIVQDSRSLLCTHMVTKVESVAKNTVRFKQWKRAHRLFDLRLRRF